MNWNFGQRADHSSVHAADKHLTVSWAILALAAASGRPTAFSALALFRTTGDRRIAAITHFRCLAPPRTVRLPAGVLTLAVSSRLVWLLRGHMTIPK